MKGRNYLSLIVGIILFVLLTACNEEPDGASEDEVAENLTESGMPIVKEPITLNIFANKAATTADDWNDIMIFNEYEEMTNINVNWEMVPVDGMEEKRNLALASQSLPDAFWGTGMPQGDLLKYGEQGIFVGLNDLIEEHAPNLKKILDENPELRKGITMPDGEIYGFPRFYDPEFTSVHLGPRLWLRGDWLEELEMDSPTTIEGFYQYLKAVKDTDLNGNGIADEIPYGGTSLSTLRDGLMGQFGIGNRGVKHIHVDMDPEEEKLRFIPTTDEYKQLLEYLHKLYSEGLIEENIFSIETGQYLANGSEGLYGSTFYYSPDMLFDGEIGSNYISAEAFEGPDGEPVYTRISSSVAILGAFVLTSANENLEATVRWIDHLYGDEGSEMFFMGFEGVTFERDADGKPVFMDEILNNPDGLTVEQAVIQYLTWPGGGTPSLIKQEHFMGSENSEMSLESAAKLEPYLIDEVWDAFTYTEEEHKGLASFGADIDKYVSEMRDKFVAGTESFDDWDKFVKTIEGMKLDEYMEIQEAAYERYKAN